MSDIEKLAKVIVNSNRLLGKQIESLTKEIRDKPSPVVNVPRATISVNPPEISVNPAEVKIEAPNITVEPTKVVVDNKEVKKLLKQILEKKAEKVDLKGLDKIAKVLTKLSEVNQEPVTIETGKEYVESIVRLSESLEGFDIKVDELLEKMEKSVKAHHGLNHQRQGGGSSGTVFLKNVAGDKINPAIEEKQVKDYFKEVAVGNVTDEARVGFGGNNPGLAVSTEESINNIRLESGFGSVYTYLTADTTLYASSSSASDTGTMVIIGMDDTYTQVVRTVTLNGQTPVALSGQMFRIFNTAIISSSKAVGNIYISDDNTDITAGVPNTLSKVKAKLDAGNKLGFLSQFTIPTGKSAYLVEFTPSSSKSADVDINLRFRSTTTEDFGTAPPFQAFQNSSSFNLVMGFTLPAQTDIDLTASSPTAGSKCTVAWAVILIDE